MCGIVGFLGDLNLEERKAFGFLLFLDTFRGKDSTGVYSRVKHWDKKTKERVVKDHLVKWVGPPWAVPDDILKKDYFTQVKQPILVPSGVDSTLLLGHNRLATVGKVNIDSAHPFEFDHIVGVHNGTIRGGLKYMKDFECDSEALYKELSECKSEEEVKEFYSRIDGAMSLVWFDRKESTLNFIRNSERPMYIGHPAVWDDKEKKTIYYIGERLLFSSDKDFADLATNRFLSFGKNKHSRWKSYVWFQQVPPHKWLRFQVENETTVNKLHVEDLPEVPLDPFVKTTTTYSNYGEGGWSNKSYYDSWKDKQKESKDNKPNHFKGRTTTGGAVEFVFGRGYLGELVTPRRFKKILEAGCVCCHESDVAFKEIERMQFFDTDCFTCPQCTEDGFDQTKLV